MALLSALDSASSSHARLTHLELWIACTAFCDGEMGQYCDHLRVLRINESESLGPAMARYFAAKLWQGEAYYMQIDAHSFFADVRRRATLLAW